MTGSERPTAIPPKKRRVLDFLRSKPLTAWRAVRIIASVTITLTIISGVLIRLTDHKDFRTFGRGLWWATQTVTTVGYGDVVPTTTVGQLIACVVMILGIAFITVTTGALASVFIEQARARMEEGETKLLVTKLDRISTRLDAIEAGLERIAP
jgi:voltage-gated potassium channel